MLINRRLAALIPFMFFMLLACPCHGEERRADQIVASMLKAYGGADAIRKVRSVTATGRIVEFLNATSGSYARYFQRPGKLRIEVMPELGGEIRILNESHVWQRGAKGFHAVSTLEIQSMNYQYSYLDLPMGLVDGTLKVTYGGSERHNGREMQLLQIAPKNAPEVRILIDVNTHLIVRVAASFNMGMMGGELATEYSDYRVADGVLFPYKLTNFAGDMKLSDIVLSDIQVNRQIPASLFTPD